MLFPESPISTNNQPSIFIELITTSNAVTLKTITAVLHSTAVTSLFITRVKNVKL